MIFTLEVPRWEKVLCYFLKVAFVVAFAMTSSIFRTMIFWKTFLHNVNKPILKSLCKFQVDIPINARLDNLYAFVEANKQWFSVLIAVLSMARLFPAHGKILEHQMQLSPQREWGLGIGDWGISGIRQWRSHGVAIGIPMAYLCNSFVLSGIDFIFGMKLS